MEIEQGKSDLVKKMEDLLEKAEDYTATLINAHKSKNRIHRNEEQQEEDILDNQPENLQNGSLKPYQLISLNWMISLFNCNLNGILADDMGLGKTIQSIAFIAYIHKYRNIKSPHLIIGPKSVLGNWKNEFEKWLPDFNVVKLIATKDERDEIIQKIIKPQDFDVCLVSFEGCKICGNILKKIKWQSVIIDEAHKIKNEDSQISIQVRKFETKFKLLLTGTPLQNNLHELYSLLNFILPQLFSDSEVFDDYFSSGQIDNQDQMISQLHRILRPFMLRRTKQEVEKQLPPKKQIHLYVGVTNVQAKLYKSLLINKSTEEGDSKTQFMNILMQLRKVCNHPYLFPGVEEDGLPELGEHLITSCGKLNLLDKLLQKLRSEGSHQILIFSQMTQVLNILEDYCNYRQFQYCRIDGNTDMLSRDEQIKQFTQKDSQKFLFLLSTRAGGLGINLATADTVVIYDSDWNPQMDLQAMDRAHRIGQQKQVNVYRLLTENSVEEKIIERQGIKLKWDHMVIQQGGMQNKMKNSMNKEEIKAMIQYGASKIIKSEGGTYTDEQIDIILTRGQEQTKQYEDKIEETLKTEGVTLNSINIYDLIKKDKHKEDEEMLEQLNLENEYELKQRKRKNLNYNINQQFHNLLTTQKDKGQKIIKLPEHHLFQQRERLQEILQKESDYLTRKKDDEYENITEEEQELKERLYKTGFNQWLKQEFYSFLKGCENYGRTAFADIQDTIKTKSLEEVQTYSEAFWNNLDQFVEKEKMVKNIEKGEKQLEQKKLFQNLIDNKCSKYSNPKLDLQFNQVLYNRAKSKFYTMDNDKYLIYISQTSQMGYGNYTNIRNAIKTEALFKFDPFIKARSELELKSRIWSLIKVIEKELDPEKNIDAVEEVSVQEVKVKKKRNRKTKDESNLNVKKQKQRKKQDEKENKMNNQEVNQVDEDNKTEDDDNKESKESDSGEIECENQQQDIEKQQDIEVSSIDFEKEEELQLQQQQDVIEKELKEKCQIDQQTPIEEQLVEENKDKAQVELKQKDIMSFFKKKD